MEMNRKNSSKKYSIKIMTNHLFSNINLSLDTPEMVTFVKDERRDYVQNMLQSI